MSCAYGDRDRAVAAAALAARIPAYVREWGGAGVDAAAFSSDDFERLPFLSKSAIMDGAAASPPFGDRLGVPREQVAMVFAAAGSIYMPFTRDDFAALAAATARALASCGLEPGDVVDQTVMYNFVIGGSLIDAGLRHLGCTVVPGGPGNTDVHLQTIMDLGVNAIVAFPSFLAHLLETAAERGLELPLRKAAISGEMREEGFKERVRREHGVTVRERYGVAEVGTVAYECAAGEGLHLSDSVLFEFVDPETGALRALDDPEPKEIVVTDVNRVAMPIIRLRTGDLVEDLIVSRCGCGSASPRIRRIVGRVGDVPRVKGMFVVPRRVEGVLRSHSIETGFQLRIERSGNFDCLTVVVARPAGGVRDAAGLQADIEGVLRMRIELLEVDALPDDAPVVDDRRVNA